MTPAGGWLLVSLVLALLCTGLGLLAEAVARTRVPGPLLPGLGLALLIVLAGLTTISGSTPALATPLCVAAALAGFGVRRPWHDVRLRCAWPWAALTGLGAFAIFAAPSVLSGQASVAGYIKLDDSAIWLGLIHHVMDHGRDISMVPPSTFQLDLRNWLAQGYPVGAFTPVGVTARATGQDVANAYQPVIAVYGAILALGLYAAAREVVRSRGLAAACALVGVQASLLLGYAQWGAIKELAAAALIPALAGLAVRGGTRCLLLAGLVAGALLDCFGVGGIVWAGSGLAAAGTVALVRREAPVSRLALALAGTAAVLVVSAVPALAVIGRNADQTANGAPTAAHDLGKLHRPLELLQGAGLWPDGDFRDPASPHGLVALLAVLGLAAAAGGVIVAVRRRAWTLPALVATVLAGGVPALAVGAPWIDAKILAITSPMLLAAAAALVAAGLRARRWAVFAAVGAGILVGGCAWSSWLVARDVFIAPRDSLKELRTLGRLLDGRGPTLVLNYEGYGTRYFLGPGQDEGATDLRVNTVPDLQGKAFPDYTTVELDAVDPRAVYGYKAIVRRRTPVGSRPPTGYRPLYAGRYFEAWIRNPKVTRPLQHIGLGTPLAPAAGLPCGQVRRYARSPGVHTLAAVPRANPIVVGLDTGSVPAAWRTPTGIRPVTDGTAGRIVTLPRAGRWRVWVGGMTLGRLTVRLDGHPVGSYRHQLDASIGWLRFGARRLAAGPHTITLAYARGLLPGHGGDDDQFPLGPLALTDEQPLPVVRVPASAPQRLCDGRSYDWLETLP